MDDDNNKRCQADQLGELQCLRIQEQSLVQILSRCSFVLNKLRVS